MKMEDIGKEYLITEYKLILTSDEAANEKKILGAYVKHVIKIGEPIGESYAREFYETILPEEPGTYWLFARRKKSYVNKVFKSKEEYISALLKLSACTDLNLFYSLANYYGKHENASVRFLKCLAVDIDDLSFDPMEKTDEELLDYVQTTYELQNKPIFNVFAVSGHGLHMYWFLNEETARFPFEEYQNHLTTYFHSDRACIPSSHYWRCPGSYNCKAEPLKTRIIALDSTPVTLEQMDAYKMTAEDIEAYRQKCNTERTAKSNATRLKNGTCAKAGTKPPKRMKATAKTTNANAEISTDGYHPLDEPFTNFKHASQDLSVAMDLHNIYVHRLKVYGDANIAFQEKRNVFIFLMVNYLKHSISEHDCLGFCCRYFGDAFKAEAIAVIRKHYASDKVYHFKYANIAKALSLSYT